MPTRKRRDGKAHQDKRFFSEIALFHNSRQFLVSCIITNGKVDGTLHFGFGSEPILRR